MIEADIAFHNAIYAASGNPMIGESARLHWGHIRRAMGAVLQMFATRAALWDEHEAIAEAIAAGDAGLAATLITRHCRSASDNITRRLPGVSQYSNEEETGHEAEPRRARKIRT